MKTFLIFSAAVLLVLLSGCAGLAESIEKPLDDLTDKLVDPKSSDSEDTKKATPKKSDPQ